jgi:hypothetical protein
MRTIFVIFALVLSMACPPVSHGFALLRYTCDLIANQLGLDRGPIPKSVSRGAMPQVCFPPGTIRTPHPYPSHLYIQAEGF